MPTIRLVPLVEQPSLHSLLIGPEKLTVRQVIERVPCLSLEQLDDAALDRPARSIQVVHWHAGLPLFLPPGMKISSNGATTMAPEGKVEAAAPAVVTPATTAMQQSPVPAPALAHPKDLGPAEAVTLAYSREIDDVASFLKPKDNDKVTLSVLVICDKLVVKYLWKEIVRKAERTAKVLEVPENDPNNLMPRPLRQRQLEKLKELIKDLHDGDVLVIPHLDLLAGGDGGLSTEAREMIELVYDSCNAPNKKGAGDRQLLAFADRSLPIPEVLADRFAVRRLITGLPRTVKVKDADRLVGEALVTASEAARFKDYDPAALYKNVAGMNPVQLRHAIAYAVNECGPEPEPVQKLYLAIRGFKAQTSAKFEVPDVSFDQIGGYDDVKLQMERALQLMAGAYKLPDEKLRRELIPRGFIFYGPPGTGKTLFAKAIANRLNATILIVSGPEVTDMYVGEGERKVRDLFAEARRNAPSVLVFDEFDSIAAQRSGRDDGGSRAGNAIVAQILTEMDGFRPEVPMLVIGTTNQLSLIDAALLRPSRFQEIRIDLPNQPARRAIARVHAKHFGIAVGDSLLDAVADATEGFNGDEIRSIFRDACVGLHCEGKPATPRRIGELVGMRRAAAQQREAEKQGKTQVVIRTGNAAPAPTGPMYDIDAAPAEMGDDA